MVIYNTRQFFQGTKVKLNCIFFSMPGEKKFMIVREREKSGCPEEKVQQHKLIFCFPTFGLPDFSDSFSVNPLQFH